MSWDSDWKKWTQVTYGIIHAVDVSQTLGGGNAARFEEAVASAQSWSTSQLGFDSSAERLSVKKDSIGIRETQVPEVLARVKSATIEILLIETVAVTEVLLSDLLMQRSIVATPPTNLSGALRTLTTTLKKQKKLDKHKWAIESLHELRILRNVLVHAAGRWTQRAVDDFGAVLKNKQAPSAGAKVTVTVDDLFAYRRAARTVLNAASRL